MYSAPPPRQEMGQPLFSQQQNQPYANQQMSNQPPQFDYMMMNQNNNNIQPPPPPPPNLQQQQQYNPQEMMMYQQVPHNNNNIQQQQQQQFPQNMVNRNSSLPQKYPALWIMGVGISNRDVKHPGAENDCSCPPCGFCCSRPVWFFDQQFSNNNNANNNSNNQNIKTNNNTNQVVVFANKPQSSVQKYNICGSWTMDETDVLGQKIGFEGREGCGGGSDSCFEPDVVVKSNGVTIGKATVKFGCRCIACCWTHDAFVATDANGTPKFVRRDKPCCCGGSQSVSWGDCCGWRGQRWPIYAYPKDAAAAAARKKSINAEDPVAWITQRYHCCLSCHPTWTGLAQVPDLPPDDQKLLLALAVARDWKAAEEKENCYRRAACCCVAAQLMLS